MLNVLTLTVLVFNQFKNIYRIISQENLDFHFLRVDHGTRIFSKYTFKFGGLVEEILLLHFCG